VNGWFDSGVTLAVALDHSDVTALVVRVEMVPHLQTIQIWARIIFQPLLLSVVLEVVENLREAIGRVYDEVSTLDGNRDPGVLTVLEAKLRERATYVVKRV
jgi:hypothetical protein